MGRLQEPKQARWKARERVRIDGCSIHRPTTDDLVTELPALGHERRKKEAPGKEKYNSRTRIQYCWYLNLPVSSQEPEPLPATSEPHKLAPFSELRSSGFLRSE